MNIVTVRIDLAKNVFAVHGIDDNGKSVLVKLFWLRNYPTVESSSGG